MMDITTLHEYCRQHLVPLIGWQKIYLVQRMIARDPVRHMNAVWKEPWNSSFYGTHNRLGKLFNYTPFIGTHYAGVKHFTFPVRDDLSDALDRLLLDQNNNTTTTNDTTTKDGDETSMYVDRTRPTDVANFWEANMTSKSAMANLRAGVSKVVDDFALRYPNYSVHSGIVGWRSKRGRSRVHPDYAKLLLESKIIVTAQRDFFEDHWRLFEGLISGALVFSDPMLDLPTGLKHGKNIVIYTSLEDLQHKLLYYLEHKEERLEIARRGREIAMKKHRRWHRWETLILADWNKRNDYGLSILD